MSLHWPSTDAWPQLLAAIQPALGPALAALDSEARHLPAVLIGDTEATSRLSSAGLHLDPRLLGPDLRHPEDQAWMAQAAAGTEALALDRFRRTVGLVLEAVALLGLAEAAGVEAEALASTWWGRAHAAEAVDRADPNLGWLWQAAADLLQHPEESLATAPRRGAWFVRWRAEVGRPLPAPDLEPPVIEDGEWRAFGAWCRDLAHGPASSCPLPLPPPKPPVDDHTPIAPLSHRPVRFQAPAAGLWVSGEAIPEGMGIPGGETRTVLIGSVAGGHASVHSHAGGPVGTWAVEAGSGGGRLFAAQGLDLRLHADGTVELIADNAFAGPVDDDMLKLARQFGATGSGTGSWRTTQVGESSGELVFDELSLSDVTIHPRMTRAFSLPGKGWLGPVKRVFEVMQGAPLRYDLTEDALQLDGSVKGFEVSLRLVRTAS